MSNKTIFDYTAAVGIDSTADYLLIEQAVGPIYKKINRNTLLGITGSPVGTSDTQNITNKTLDNTNTVTLKDTLFTLQDDGDTTKQARFQLSGITTATTRTYTLPNASSTLADIATAQTFTNKTLTSPAITGGTIDNSTITVDSIAGHTSATVVTVGGVQMNNGTIGTSNAVVTASIADSAVTPAKLVAGSGTGWPYQTWTVTWTGLTVGNATVVQRYNQTGKTIQGRIDFILGTTSAVSGDIVFSLPVTSASYAGTSALPPIGLARFYNAGAVVAEGYVVWLSTTTAAVRPMTASGTYVALASASSTVPFTWATSYEFSINFCYEAA